MGHHNTPIYLNLSQAARAVGKSRSTINRDIKKGKVSADRDGRGQPVIQLAELERAYGTVQVETVSDSASLGHSAIVNETPGHSALEAENKLLRDQLADRDDQIGYLRQRLDQSDEERRRLTALLTDQRAQKAPEKPTEPWFKLGPLTLGGKR